MNDTSLIGRLRSARAHRTPHSLPRRVVAEASGSQNTIRVATYNIHKGVLREYFGLKRIPRIHELRTRLHEIEADLIFLQEVQGRHAFNERRYEQWPLDSQEQFLARSPTLTHTFESVYGQNATYLHGHHGNALLSRYRIVRHEQRDISDHALEKRGLLHCVTQIGGRDVHCFVVHFGLFASSRQRQLEAMIDWIADEVPSSAPLIIAGDFNDWREKLSDTLCGSLGMVEVFDAMKMQRRMAARAGLGRDRLYSNIEPEAFRVSRPVRGARTFPALVPWLRMDRIYQRGFAVEHVRVLRGPTWARLSDHSPLVADLRLKD